MDEIRALQACLHARLRASEVSEVCGGVVDVGNVLTLSWGKGRSVLLALWEPLEAAVYVTLPGSSREVCLGTWSGARDLTHGTVGEVDGLADDLWDTLRAQDAEPDPLVGGGSLRVRWYPGVLAYAEWELPAPEELDPDDVLESKED